MRALDVDYRTDIFAFGAILYEMLTGHRAFRRDTSVETMNAILNDDPPEIPSAQQPVPAVSRIVLRCLEKSRAERFQSARDLAFALDALSGSTPQKAVAAAAVPRAWRRVWLAAAAGVLLIVLAAAAAYFAGRRSAVERPSPRFTELTFAAGAESQPAISPNGENFAFVRDGDIWLQRTDARNAINLTRSADTMEGAPAFSADGRNIAFATQTGLFVMGATGESVRRITDAGFDPTWSPDGKQVAFVRNEPTTDPRSRNSRDNPLMVVDAAGGTPRQLIPGDAMQPRWSPDGRRIAYWANDRSGRRDIFTVSSAGGKETIVPVTADVALDWSPAWSPDSRWLYFSSDRGGTMTLWRVGIDSRSGRTRGEPQLISAPASAAGWIAVSGDGRSVVFEAMARSSTVRRARFDVATSQLISADAPVLDGSLLIRGITPSPDGSLLAFTTEGREDLFVMRSDGSEIRQLTNDDARDRGANWTHDGRITFYSARSGSYQTWSIRPDGSGLQQMSNLSDDLFPNFPIVSPDGKRVAASTLNQGAWMAPITDTPFATVETLPRLPGGAAFWPQSWSPDGQRLTGVPWINESGVYVYSIAARTYTEVAADGRRAAWIDDRRILTLDFDKVTLLDTATGERKELAQGDWSPIASACTYEHCLLVSNRTESNIWMATLPVGE